MKPEENAATAESNTTVAQNQDQNEMIAQAVVKKESEKTEKPKKKSAPKKKTAPKKKAVTKRTARAGTKIGRSVDNTGRNFGRIKIGGKELLKGKAIHEAVVLYVAKKKPTLAQLKVAFPDVLQPQYGVLQEASKARKFDATGRSRYYTSAEMLIVTKDGKKVAVCNQWTNESVKPVMKQAKTLGIVMTPVK